MIGIVDVEIQAANPQMPLYPMRAFVNSPSSVRVRNVPTEVGAWKITSVRVVVAYPDSSIKTADCVLAGSVWVATVAGCAVSGTSENGFTVFASGVDENGDAVANYVLGKGNVEILKADGTLSPDAPSYYVHLFDEAPTAPNEGDMWPTADGFVIWQDGEAHALGGSSITVDPALSQTSENPVQNKVVSKALYTGFTEWEFSGVPSGYSVVSCEIESEDAWMMVISDGTTSLSCVASASEDSVEVIFGEFYDLMFDPPTQYDYTITATRHLVTPTKTSQLTNDSDFAPAWAVLGKLDGAAAYPAWVSGSYATGDIRSFSGRLYRLTGPIADQTVPPPNASWWTIITLQSLLAAKQDTLTSAQMDAVNSGATAAKVATWDGYAAQIAQKANASDLPYAMVTLGAWEFSGSGWSDEYTFVSMEYDSGKWVLSYENLDGDTSSLRSSESTETANVVEFPNGGITITATRNHLLDRANNLIDATTGNVPLTLPPFVAGKVRDMLVACTIGLDTNDEPWSVIFQGQGSEAPSGADEISFKAEGDDAESATFPVPAAAGDWWYSLTERAPHVFAVSLKQLQSVSQPTQGGS